MKPIKVIIQAFGSYTEKTTISKKLRAKVPLKITAITAKKIANTSFFVNIKLPFNIQPITKSDTANILSKSFARSKEKALYKT